MFCSSFLFKLGGECSLGGDATRCVLRVGPVRRGLTFVHSVRLGLVLNSHILQRSCFCLVFLANGEAGVEVAGVAEKAGSSYERAGTAALSLGWCSV